MQMNSKEALEFMKKGGKVVLLGENIGDIYFKIYENYVYNKYWNKAEPKDWLPICSISDFVDEYKKNRFFT